MIVIFGLGLYVVTLINANLVISMLLAILFSLTFVQIARIFERETDYFVAKHISDPNGMITGARKMAKAYLKGNLGDLRRVFLGWNVLPEERIEIAKKELARR